MSVTLLKYLCEEKKWTLLSNHYTFVFDKNLKQINNSYGKKHTTYLLLMKMVFILKWFVIYGYDYVIVEIKSNDLTYSHTVFFDIKIFIIL